MNPNEYQRLAMTTEADQDTIHVRVFQLGPQATRLDNGVRGLTDEVGELAGATKRWLEYGQGLDANNILEEVGDCLWRLSQICKACGLTLEQAMEANLRKLQVRYDGQAATPERAAEEARDRPAEREAMERKWPKTTLHQKEIQVPRTPGPPLEMPGPPPGGRIEQDGHGFGHTEEPKPDDEPPIMYGELYA